MKKKIYLFIFRNKFGLIFKYAATAKILFHTNAMPLVILIIAKH